GRGVPVEAKIGLLRDRVIVDEREYEVLRGRRGWRAIVDPRGPAGRVRYDGLRDRISIDSVHGVLEIRFRWRHTAFAWRGRMYRVGSMAWNRLTIWDGDRPALEGKMTWGGLRRQHQAYVRGVFPCEEHSPALDSPELGGLQVNEDDDLPTAELLLRIVLPDPRDDLSALSSDVHLEDVQVVGVRMVCDVHD